MSLWKVVLGISIAFAQTGVGVGLGKVSISEPLAPGGIYRLPDLPVVNTGKVPGEYHVTATDSKNVSSTWLSFAPQSFRLEPGQSQLVRTTLTLPLTAPDGDYLVYLEASPVQNPQKGVAIGPAVATKLYFSVKSGSVLGAVRNRVLTFVYTRPEIYLVLAAIFLLQALLILRRHFRVEIRPRRNRNLR
jgi:hypothetical protein